MRIILSKLELLPEQEDFLYLGSWCYAHKIISKEDIHLFSKESVKNPWDNRQNLKSACDLLERHYESVMASLASSLNTIHGVNYSLRYWKILIGEWVQHFIHVVFERYYRILEVAKAYKKIHYVGSLFPSAYTAWDMEDFKLALQSDAFNHQLFSNIILFLNGHKNRDIKYDSQQQLHEKSTREERAIAPYILVGEMCCDGSILSRLMESLGDKAIYWNHSDRTKKISGRITNADAYKRSNLLLDYDARSSFEGLIYELLPDYFPLLYLENFHEARNQILEQFKLFPQVIVTANDWHINERFKFLAAESCELGAKLFIGQHGGFYGTSLYSPAEYYEYDISDRYLVWGWGHKKKHVNLPSLKSTFAQSLTDYLPQHKNSTNQILFLSTELTYYTSRLLSSSLDSQILEDVLWDSQLLDDVEENLRSKIVWRSKYPEHNSPQSKIVQKKYPEIQYIRYKNWQEWASQYWPLVLRSRIIIMNNISSSILEMLALNIPCIVCCNPFHWEVRESAESYMQVLARAKIFFNNPKDAAQHINQVYSNVEEWWDSNVVQEARNTFVSAYARLEKSGEKEWASFLLTSLDEQRKKELSINSRTSNETKVARPLYEPEVLRETKFINIALTCIKKEQLNIRLSPLNADHYEKLKSIYDLAGCENPSKKAKDIIFSLVISNQSPLS